MSKEQINRNVYETSFRQLTQRDCPVALASEASLVIAKDDPTKEDLGRSDRDQYVISETLPYLQ